MCAASGTPKPVLETLNRKIAEAVAFLASSDAGAITGAVLQDARAIPTFEREALDSLKDIESVGWAARGGQIRARVSAEALAWLEADSIGWKAAGRCLSSHRTLRYTIGLPK